MHEYDALIQQIALYLGRPWKLNTLDQDSCWQRYLIDGQGRGLIISKQYNAPKFSISGRFDKNITDAFRDDYLSIGVSVNRTAKAIAGDIQRHLLPHYLKSVCFHWFRAWREMKFCSEQAKCRRNGLSPFKGLQRIQGKISPRLKDMAKISHFRVACRSICYGMSCLHAPKTEKFWAHTKLQTQWKHTLFSL